MIKQEPIDGGTVRLRAYREDDADDVAAACDDPLTQRFLPDLPDPVHPRGRARLDPRGRPGGVERRAAPRTRSPTRHRPAARRRRPRPGRARPGAGRDRLLGGAVGARPGRRHRAATARWPSAAFAAGLSRLELLAELENPASQRVALARRVRATRGCGGGAAAARDGARRDLLAFARLSTDPAGPIARLLPDLPGGALTDGVVTLRPLAPDRRRLPAHGCSTSPTSSRRWCRRSRRTARRSELRCARAESRWLAGERADLVICDAATGAPAGDIGLYYQEPPTQQAMIGYCAAAGVPRRGFTTRAAVLLARWAFADTGIARLIAGTNPDNVGSQRVLERAGFRREGYQRSRLPGVTDPHRRHPLRPPAGRSPAPLARRSWTCPRFARSAWQQVQDRRGRAMESVATIHYCGDTWHRTAGRRSTWLHGGSDRHRSC